MNSLPVHDNRYIKCKLRTYGDKVCTNFMCFKFSKNGLECESFTSVSTVLLLVYEKKYYLQVYFDNCAYKNLHK